MEILKISKESLENSITGLSQLEPVLQKQCLEANLDGQGKEDAKELGEHFETAINSMVTVLGLIETAQEVPVQEQCNNSIIIKFDSIVINQEFDYESFLSRLDKNLLSDLKR